MISPPARLSTRRRCYHAKTICMVVHNHYASGEDPRVWRAARAAVEAGWKVTVVCLRHLHEPAREMADGVSVHRVPVEHVPGSSLRRVLYEYVASTVLATVAVLHLHLRERQTIVYVHSPPDFLILAGVIPKLLGSRIVLDIHDLSPLIFDVRYSGRRGTGALIRMLTAVQVLATRIADRVVTVHAPYVRELAASGVPEEKITIVMNSPEEAVIERALTHRRRRSGAFVLAYHGTITEWYGLDLLVHAVARLQDEIPEISALVLGDGGALDDLRTLARRLGIENSVRFSGRFLAVDEALARVAGASCGILPNLATPLNQLTLSSKLLDYAALGVPAVVSKLETQAFHFSPDEVTFFAPGDLNGLVEAVRWVAQHPEEAREKAARARRRALTYAWPTQRALLQELLSDLDGGARTKELVR